MTDKLKQSEINATAWAACDTFRGVVDPAQYKDYILVMLFLKYISDTWQDHYDDYKKQYGDDEERIHRKLARERFVLPKGVSFYDLYEKRNEANIGELINIALDAIEEANKTKLEGVFRNIDFNSEANLFPTTGIPVAILVFDRSREKPAPAKAGGGANGNRRDVVFIDASREYESGKNQNTLTVAHIDKILATCQARKDLDKYAHVASFEEIAENDFNLNIPRYVDTFEEEEEIDIDAMQREIEQLEKELAEVRAKMAEKLKEIER